MFGSYNHLFGQSYQMEWANCMGGEGYDYARNIATDDSGYVYIAGSVNDTADMDPGPNSFFFYGQGDYVAKYNSLGNFVWAKSFNTDAFMMFGGNIALDLNGNIIITGFFMGIQDFDPGPGVYNLTSNGSTDAYILKLDPAGGFVWAKNIGGMSEDAGMDVAVNGQNQIVIVGYNGEDPAIDFDPNAGAAYLNSTFNYSSFILKLDSGGNYIWAKKIDNDPGGTQGGFNMPTRVSVDEHQNIIFLGQISLPQMIDCDPGTGVFIIQSTSQWADGFICKLDSAGNFNWAKHFSSGESTMMDILAVDLSGSSYIGSYVLASLGGTTLDADPGGGTYNLTTNGQPDVFLIKLDSDGNFAWAKQFGGDGPDYPYDCCYRDGKLYTVGTYMSASAGTGSVDFDPGPGTYMINNPFGNGHFFMSVIDTAGSFDFALALGDNTEGLIPRYAGVSVTNEGSPFITGTYKNLNTSGAAALVDFDPGPAIVNVNYNQEDDIFLVRLNRCILADTTTAISCDSYDFNGQTYELTGAYSYMPPGTPGLCDSSHVLNLTINYTPDTSVTRSGINLTSAATNASYQWLDCDNGNAAIPGATNPSFIPTQDGNYAVALMGAGGCNDTSYCYNVSVTRIEEVQGSKAFTVYPNPATDEVFIRPLYAPFSYAVIRLFTIGGQLLSVREAVAGNNYVLDMRAYSSGVYFIEIKNKENTYRVKLIKH
jgi:hypothetical protein